MWLKRRGRTRLRRPRHALHAFFLLALCCLGIPLRAEEAQSLRFVMSAENPPISHLQAGEAQGILRELLEELFGAIPEYRLVLQPLPWARAQLEVASERADGFCTFPSEQRQSYAVFSAQPMYVWDYGSLIYSGSNPRAARLAQAASFEDLRELLFISQEGVDWERENVPGFIRRYSVNSPRQMIHMLFRRDAGDFIIMSPEQALHYARLFGYTEQLRSTRVAFIPNSRIGFHIGLRKTLPEVERIMGRIDQAMADRAFQARREAIVERYRMPSIQ